MPRIPDTPEREQTDQSLRTERDHTDRALGEQKAAAEKDARNLIERARDTADAVLATARGEADVRLQATAPPPAAVAAIATERRSEDAVLRQERAWADESVRREREENARALAMLLPLEREKTDRFLLTERVRSDDSLANRDDFLGIVSHDLRNLLGAIVMGNALIAKAAAAGQDAPSIVAATDRIQRYAARMNRLIGDLVDIGAIDAGRLTMTCTRGDVRALVREALDTFAPSAEAKGISLKHDEETAALPANFDHDRMLQVLGNVLANALKFTSDGGTVHVHEEQADGEIRISVRDTGCGIPPEMLDLVFQRFWQVGENDRRGSGLGLYISKSIVEAHGGRMWAESTADAGSTFVITLPALPA